MRSILIPGFALSMILSSACMAQEWEVGALGGFGWYHNATIRNPSLGSATAGFEPRFAVGAVVDQNMYNYIGGELRYMFIVGGPVLKFDGVTVSNSGYTNVVHYDLMIHTTPRESTFRPYFSGGAGIKVFSGTNLNLFQPLTNFAILRHVNQVEPLLSAGGGVKYMFRRGAQFRLDFRTYFSPTPDDVFFPVFPSRINGWIVNFVPSLGFSYVF